LKIPSTIKGWEMTAVGAPLTPSARKMESLANGQAVIEVLGCGVCHTDLGFLDDGVPTRHALPLVLGHEVVGRVVAHANSGSELIGCTVLVPAVMPCGDCAQCERDRGDICPLQVFPGNDDHGGFASHLVVPARGLCPVPRDRFDADGEKRLAVIADAVSTAYAAIRKSGLSEGDFAVFVGAGGVGGFGAQIAHALGARVLAIDVDDERLALIAEHGASWTLNARDRTSKDLKKQVRSLAKEQALPAAGWKIFETSGTATGQETAFSLLTFGAALGVVGYHPGDVKVRLSNLMAFAARAEGTWGCPPRLFPEILELVCDEKVVLEPFVEMHPMARINEVFEALRNHQLKKRPILVPDFA